MAAEEKVTTQEKPEAKKEVKSEEKSDEKKEVKTEEKTPVEKKSEPQTQTEEKTQPEMELKKEMQPQAQPQTPTPKEPEKKSSKKKKFRVKSWYANRYQFVLVQRNILLLFALLSTVAVSFGMIFLNHVVSSKSLEPYIIEVEEKTGIPTVVKQKTTEEFTGNELMKKYFLNKFIHISTGYNPKTYPEDLKNVRVFSNPTVFSNFRSRIRPRDLGTTNKITVKIKSFEFPNESTARVRILRKSTNTQSGEFRESNELLNIKFYFNPNLQLNQQERLRNPLGFQVVNYSITEEILDY